MTDYADLVTYIRAQTEWCSRSLSGGDWFAIDPDVAPFRAADAIETLAKQVEWAIDQRDLYQRQREAAEAEAEKWRSDHHTQSKRLTSAEAEVARLREAIDVALAASDDCPIKEAMTAAMEAKP